jgi:exonuclease VII large subunit
MAPTVKRTTKSSTSKTDAPKTDAPKTDTPKTDTPKTDAPDPLPSPGSAVELPSDSSIAQLQQQLTAVEQRLVNQVTAIGQRLLDSPSSDPAIAISDAVSEQIQPHLSTLHQRLEHLENALPQQIALVVDQALTPLRQQINELAQTLFSKDSEQSERLATQVERLVSQVDRLEANPAIVMESAQSKPAPLTEPAESDVSNPDVAELPSDPLLNRLSHFLEEF